MTIQPYIFTIIYGIILFYVLDARYVWGTGDSTWDVKVEQWAAFTEYTISKYVKALVKYYFY